MQFPAKKRIEGLSWPKHGVLVWTQHRSFKRRLIPRKPKQKLYICLAPTLGELTSTIEETTCKRGDLCGTWIGNHRLWTEASSAVGREGCSPYSLCNNCPRLCSVPPQLIQCSMHSTPAGEGRTMYPCTGSTICCPAPMLKSLGKRTPPNAPAAPNWRATETP